MNEFLILHDKNKLKNMKEERNKGKNWENEKI